MKWPDGMTLQQTMTRHFSGSSSIVVQ